MPMPTNKHLLVLPILIFALCGCANNQGQIRNMQLTIDQQTQQIQQLKSQLSGVQPAQADTWAQLQSLRQEMASVKGQIDDFNNATSSFGGISSLAQRINRHEQALQAIQTRFDLDLNLDQPVAGGINPPQTVTQANSVPSPVVSTPPVQQPAKSTAPQEATSDIAKSLYDSGIESFNARKFKDSANAFSDFTKTYPKHRLAGNAWFWLGESNFQTKNYAEAALNYNQVIDNYASSGKLASAYLKQGMCFINTKKTDAAKYRLNELIQKFPKSAEATRAKELLKKI